MMEDNIVVMEYVIMIAMMMMNTHSLHCLKYKLTKPGYGEFLATTMLKQVFKSLNLIRQNIVVIMQKQEIISV